MSGRHLDLLLPGVSWAEEGPGAVLAEVWSSIQESGAARPV